MSYVVLGAIPQIPLNKAPAASGSSSGASRAAARLAAAGVRVASSPAQKAGTLKLSRRVPVSSELAKKLNFFKKNPVLSVKPAMLRYSKADSLNALSATRATLGSFHFNNVSISTENKKVNDKLAVLEKELNKTSLKNNDSVKDLLNNLPLNPEQKKVILDNPGTVVRALSASLEQQVLVDVIKRVRLSVEKKRPSNRYGIVVDGRSKTVVVDPSANQSLVELLLQFTCVSNTHFFETLSISIAYGAEKGVEGLIKAVDGLLAFGADVAEAVGKGLAEIAKNTEKAVAAGVAAATKAAEDVVQATQQFVEGVADAVEDIGESIVSFFGLGEPITITTAVVILGVGLISVGVLCIVLLVFGDFVKAFCWKGIYKEDIPPELYMDDDTKQFLRQTATTSVAAAADAATNLGAGAEVVGALLPDIVSPMQEGAAQNGVQLVPTGSTLPSPVEDSQKQEAEDSQKQEADVSKESSNNTMLYVLGGLAVVGAIALSRSKK